MEPDSVSLTQLPERLSRDDYETGRQRIISEFSDRDDLLSIYDYGTVEHPGISDLDVMLVFQHDSTPSWVTDLSTKFDPLVNNLVGRGNIIIIDDKTFQKLNYIDPNLDPKHLVGKQISRESVDNETATYRDHASVMDWLPERVYQAERLTIVNEIPVMRTLQLLKSLGYSLRIVDDRAGFDPGVAFADSVTSLRSSWFEISEKERRKSLIEHIKDAQSVGRDALRFWLDRRPNQIFSSSDSPRVSDESNTALSYFDELVYVTGQQVVSRSDGWIQIGIPDSWFDHYRAYAQHESKLGTLIEESMVGNKRHCLGLTKGYESFLEKKTSGVFRQLYMGE